MNLGKKVPAEGNLNASIMIVGESPGSQETIQGRPFVGPVGQRFEEVLGRIGLQRSQLFLTNACKYEPKGLPPERKMEWFWQGGLKKGRPQGPPTPQFAEGIAELISEIEQVKPNVIVPMGNPALWAVTGYAKIMSYRGSILESTIKPGLKAVPCVHPSYFIRGNWAEHPLLIWDLKRAKEESDDPTISLPKRNLVIFPTEGEVDEAITRLLSAHTVAIDTEWFTPDHLACIGFTDDPSWAICIPASASGAIQAYEAILRSGCRKVFQNAMFDVVYLERIGLRVKDLDSEGNRLIEDTMVGHFVNWPDIRKGLETTTAIYTREPYYKDEYKVAIEGDTIDLNLYYSYNCKDVCVTMEIWQALENYEFKRWNTRRAYELNMLTFPVMRRSTTMGMRADYEKLHEGIAFYKQRADVLQEQLDEVLGTKINVRSPMQVREVVYKMLKIRRTGKKTDADTLMDIAAQTNDLATEVILKLIVSIRRDRNMPSKYMNEKLVDIDGRVRTYWNMAGTETGRLSASKDDFRDRGVALNTMPRPSKSMPYNPRDICIPDEGNIFIKPDLSQAEARVVACLSQDWRVIDWMEAGLDIHSKLAEAMFEIPYHEIEKDGEHRYLAKTCRHALNYIMGPSTFKLTINEKFMDTGFGVTMAKARELRDKYLTIHSPLLGWWTEVKTDLGRNGMQLTNLLGRTRTFTDAWGDPLHRSAVAFVPQSTVSDITHTGIHRCVQALPYLRVHVNLHDGFLGEVPEDKLDEALPIIKDCMTYELVIKEHRLVIPVDIETGYSWGSMERWQE